MCSIITNLPSNQPLAKNPILLFFIYSCLMERWDNLRILLKGVGVTAVEGNPTIRSCGFQSAVRRRGVYLSGMTHVSS